MTAIRESIDSIIRASGRGDWRAAQSMRLVLLDSLHRRSARHEAERRELIVAVHDTERLDRLYDERRAQAMADATGQELDDFYGEGL